jgi:hypothetical protein
MKRRLFSLALGALVAWAVAGCGSSPESDPLTRSAFIKQGNAICKEGGEERDAEPREVAKESSGSDESTEAELEKFVSEVVLPPIQSMTDELGDLGVPEKDEKQVEGIVAGFEEAIEEVEADPGSVLSGDPFIDAGKRAEAYGLTECVI